MIGEAVLPMYLAAVVAVLVVLGALLTFLGSYGLLQLPTFYERVHPPTMGATLGTALVLAASAILFSALQSRPILHELVIGLFMVVATPVTYMLLVRAAMHRDRGAAEADEPAQPKDQPALRQRQD